MAFSSAIRILRWRISAEKMRSVARDIYGASDIALAPAVLKQLERWRGTEIDQLPVCFAKTQYSFSADPTRLGAPSDHIIPVQSVRLSAGAGFVVALAGDIRTMPGLPRHPAALDIKLVGGQIEGLS